MPSGHPGNYTTLTDVTLLGFNGVANFAQASTYASQSGADIVFNLGGGNILRVANATLASLADDMVFV